TSNLSTPRPVLTSAFGASAGRADSRAGTESRMSARRMGPPGGFGWVGPKLCTGGSPSLHTLDHIPDAGAEAGVGDPFQAGRKPAESLGEARAVAQLGPRNGAVGPQLAHGRGLRKARRPRPQRLEDARPPVQGRVGREAPADEAAELHGTRG